VPILLLYELLIIYFHYDHGNTIRNAADVWIKYVINIIGAHGTFAFGIFILVLVIFGFVSMVREKQDINLKFAVLAVLESSVYAWLLAFVATRLTQFVLVHLLISDERKLNLVLSLGAGVYEEIIFRAIGYGLVPYVLFRIIRLFDRSKSANSKKRESANHHIGFELKLFAAIISSIMFAWLHNMNSFSLLDYTTLYRFCMGLLFCVLYEFRGLGIVVWTHSFYDVFVYLSG